ncbi:hypothetical protein [Neorhizobium galegae]|uniref:hypothetical protein n=1 Tax=Neorhizobium galegae TaxID=399 RepID=UPI002106CE9B|nr:hypothetical protein [Neorhizobium galegae]MCQ1839232.1 hypothetical protein [Neorhizobium galegae]
MTLGVGKNGDNAQEVNRTLDLFRTHHCDVVVCATKSSGASVNALNAFLAANPTITIVRVPSNFVPPYVPGSISLAQASANSAVAASIEANIP